jgi:hypothetical protein
MRIHLSALGWIVDAPSGNRLRWHYPADAVHDGRYIGLPERVRIDRAPVQSRETSRDDPLTGHYPIAWWDLVGDVPVSSSIPLFVHTLTQPVQVFAFTWIGGATRFRVGNAGGGQDVYDRVILPGEHIIVHGALIDTVVVYAATGTLKDVRTLDLFRDRGLKWTRLAEIAVAPALALGLDDVAPRYVTPPTISAGQWRDLSDQAATAQASQPADAIEGELTEWESLALVVGMRWEIAVLAGSAFVDGPHAERTTFDKLSQDLLAAPTTDQMAYRVVAVGGPKASSNIAVCPAGVVAPLGAPSVPTYVNPVVHLRERGTASTAGPEPGRGRVARFKALSTARPDFEVHARVAWTQSDPLALGVEIEERVSASAIAPSAAEVTRYSVRTRRGDAEPLEASITRVLDVDFPDVTLKARARAIDAWDRSSAPSPWSAPASLTLRHEPPAPPLASAAYDAGTVRLTRALGVPGVPDWAPDVLVRKTAGRVVVYRQTNAPRSVAGTIGAPTPGAGGLYRAVVSGVPSLGDFVGGVLSVGSFVETIEDVVGNEVRFRVPGNGGVVAQIFAAGSARLSQDPRHAALWSSVTDFPAEGLPSELVFSDPLPSATRTGVESYHLRLFYFGRLGPAGGTARALRYAAPITVPPPFVADILGIDFYHRTLLRVRFTSPASSGRFSLWWADGTVAGADFPRKAAAGLYGAQAALDGITLFDVLPLPIPQFVARTITIGVQRVTEGGPQSDFVTVPMTLMPLLGP